MPCQAILVDILSSQTSARHLSCDRLNGRNDFSASAIGQCDRKSDLGILPRQGFRARDHADDVWGETSELPDYLQANAVALQFRDLTTEIMAQQHHQILHFGGRALPIFR